MCSPQYIVSACLPTDRGGGLSSARATAELPVAADEAALRGTVPPTRSSPHRRPAERLHWTVPDQRASIAYAFHLNDDFWIGTKGSTLRLDDIRGGGSMLRLV